MEQEMPLFQLFVTIVLSGVVSGALIFGLQERRERASLLLQKAESAAEAFVAWGEQMQKWPSAHFDLFFAGEDARAVARAQISAIYAEASKMSARAQMLINIYLPNRCDAIAIYLQSFAQWFDVSRQLQHASLEGAPLPDWAAASIQEVGSDMVQAHGTATAKLYA